MENYPPAAIGPPKITDEDLAASAPTVRALLVGRLEAMWVPIQQALDDGKAGLGPPDPRMLEIGLRIVKEESTLYRLLRPPTLVEQDEEMLGPGVDRAALVEAHLVEIEQRIKEAEASRSTGH